MHLFYANYISNVQLRAGHTDAVKKIIENKNLEVVLLYDFRTNKLYIILSSTHIFISLFIFDIQL